MSIATTCLQVTTRIHVGFVVCCSAFSLLVNHDDLCQTVYRDCVYGQGLPNSQADSLDSSHMGFKGKIITLESVGPMTILQSVAGV